MRTFLRAAATMVRGLARRKLADTAVVSPEDIVQETLLAVHLKRHTWRPQEPILPWLFTIARYKVVDCYRRKGQRVFVDVDDFAELLAAPETSEQSASARQLEEALVGLSEGQQRVVRAIAVEGRSITETAVDLRHEGDGRTCRVPPRACGDRDEVWKDRMKTDDLIATLSTDAQRPGLAPDRALALAVTLGAVIAAAMLFLTMGVRPDFMAAAGTIRFLFKFVVTLTVAASALALVRQSLYPENSKLNWPLLLAGPAVLAIGVIAELFALPPDAIAMSAQGKNALLCLTVVPALGITPLGLLVWALRRGAPTHPVFAGFCAGILAGGIAATFYAANCTDDSPLFVATWYPISIIGLGLVGSLLGARFARW